jgi:hypothetical protein
MQHVGEDDAIKTALFNGCPNLSLLMTCATVAINLVVGELDKKGRSETGDRVDEGCRTIFPRTYLGVNAVMLVIAFTFF